MKKSIKLTKSKEIFFDFNIIFYYFPTNECKQATKRLSTYTFSTFQLIYNVLHVQR